MFFLKAASQEAAFLFKKMILVNGVFSQKRAPMVNHKGEVQSLGKKSEKCYSYYMNNIESAKEFATRKFAEVNVENHFLEVYGFLKEDFKVNDENILVAGLLHDVLEDTNTTDEEMSEKFGQDVLNLVLEVSHVKNWKDPTRPEMTKQDLMSEYYEHIREIPGRAKLIKIADFTSHMGNFIKIYQKNEQHLYPKFVNNDKYITQIQNFLNSCEDSLAKEKLWKLTVELEQKNRLSAFNMLD